uniref:Euchromatic histone-lysine N-methyltransferase 2 n=1 Tax=Scleropages formosus TaxID=113540 RepID=A0A8C9W5F2_SCLFO
PSPWTGPGRVKKRRDQAEVEQMEVELDEGNKATRLCAQSCLCFSQLVLSSITEGSEGGETERLEELPLCSCRMEAPRVDSLSGRGGRLCMATESINGEGTFLECCPDMRIAHRFHRSCVSVLGGGRDRGLGLGGMLFCPHCGEDASEAQEVTIPATSSTATVVTASASTTTPFLPSPLSSSLSLGVASGVPGGGRRPEAPTLQKAILTQETERRKKLRFHPRQLYPAAKQGEVQRVLLMLMEGIDPAYQSDCQNRRCALHAAAQRGLLEMCYLLIQAGAKVDAQDKAQRTPLLEAIVNNHIDVVRYLIQSGACEDDGSTGLHHAAKLGNLEIVNLLLGTGQVDINAQDSGGWTPIIWAAEHRHINVIRALLNRGADVTLKDKEMNVCLHWASFAGSVEIAELLLNAGCPLSSVNVHGDTPLHIASREGYLDCVTLFLSRGADIDVMNREGDTPISLSSVLLLSMSQKSFLNNDHAPVMSFPPCFSDSDVAQGYENVPIPCVNGVDEEDCPSDYKYISENCETSAMNIDRNITHLQHCSCTDDCSSSNCLCGQLSIRCWYDKDRRLLQEFNKIEPPLIFECNLACSCYRTCKNRVVQEGIKVRLQLYRTEKMGWGVRALQDIPQGSFICEYVGELISDAEADVREDDSYLFDLDNKDGEVYCIDARYYGNISRFINHLCDPNIIPVRVFMLHQDLRFPRIAFFSSRDILTGQELGFDYGDRFWDIKSKYFTCQCGSEKCKHSAEAIALEQSRLARLEACPDAGPDAGLPLLGNP